ncbi:MAG: hypothetical protein JXM74_10945, partial [Fusobacteriaceae bacterium]|nr:hypothetical protein [Fusobacteriaceae bacterium]
MDKKSLIGSVLIALLITGYFVYSSRTKQNNEDTNIALENVQTEKEDLSGEIIPEIAFSKPKLENGLKEEIIEINNEFLNFKFTNKGGTAKAITVLKNKEITEEVELLFA